VKSLDGIVSSADLGIILKITTRRVNQLADENVIFREQTGKFNLADSCENFYSWKFKSDGKIDFAREHALFEKAKREKAELDLQQHKKELLLATDVEHLMAGMILTCKAKLLSIPSKVAPKLLKQTNPAIVVDLIQAEIYEALSELKEIPAERIIEADNAVNT
jgi:phage terminase Nu1 subunit (DNA packaging protein)